MIPLLCGFWSNPLGLLSGRCPPAADMSQLFGFACGHLPTYSRTHLPADLSQQFNFACGQVPAYARRALLQTCPNCNSGGCFQPATCQPPLSSFCTYTVCSPDDPTATPNPCGGIVSALFSPRSPPVPSPYGSSLLCNPPLDAFPGLYPVPGPRPVPQHACFFFLPLDFGQGTCMPSTRFLFFRPHV